MMRRIGLWPLAAGLLAVTGCYRGAGTRGDAFGDGSADGETAGDDGMEPAPEAGGVGLVGMRRLSRAELDNTLRDLLGDDTRPAATALSEDVIDPFDNDYSTQKVSTVLIENLETLAIDVADRFVADTARRNMVVGCEPSNDQDEGCLRSFVTAFGRRALRRALTVEEIDAWTALGLQFANDGSDFYEGVNVIVRTLLQHPQFIYRVEVGTPTDQAGVFKLDDWEVATRLSYFVWGSMPDDELLDRAEAEALGTPEEVLDAARQMLEDDRARERVDRFHAMWMGYHQLPHAAALTNNMRNETRALLDDIVFDDPRAYTQLFTADGTFANDELAQHYGLTPPGSNDFVWVPYGDSGRAGILSHGSFLSVASKFEDTSPTQRGILIRTRLLCQVIPPPPPTVNVDNPPTSPDSNCKVDRYAEHRNNGACRECHQLVDPVGFGLENYDREGRFRDVEPDAPECNITGEGDIDGDKFTGPAELAQYLVDEQLLDTCVVTQIYRFAMGHREADEDMRYIVDLEAAFAEGGHRFDDLMLTLVSDEAFLFRREEN